jgi:hypothetical protein
MDITSVWLYPIYGYNVYMSSNVKKHKQLTPRQKDELTKAVKKTVKQYKVTLKLLAKT